MPVELSNGVIVTFKPYFTHKGDRLYWEAVDRCPPETPNHRKSRRGMAASMPALIVSAQAKDGTSIAVDEPWLDNLEVSDYEKLLDEVLKLMNQAVEKLTGAEKKS